MQKKISKHICQICLKEQKYIGRHLKFNHPEFNLKEYYDNFLKQKTEGICLNCKKDTKFSGYIVEGYKKYCSKTCCCQQNMKKRTGVHLSPFTKKLIKEKRLAYFQTKEGKAFKKYLSVSRKGLNNPVHRQTAETKAKTKIKQSVAMKQLIQQGKFTPPITNSWCFSRVVVHNIPFRSCWEAAFYILNPTLIYEKIRIPYKNNKNKIKNYIVDFVDEVNHILYEVKPNTVKDNINNIKKQQAALAWCKNNNYTYTYISDEYFKKNAFKIDYSKYDPKIKKSMKKFLV
jgi:hypothetical protein